MRVQKQEAWLTPEEVSSYLKVPVPTLYVWRHRGKGPRAVRVGRHLRYLRADVDAWLATLAREQELTAS